MVEFNELDVLGLNTFAESSLIAMDVKDKLTILKEIREVLAKHELSVNQVDYLLDLVKEQIRHCPIAFKRPDCPFSCKK